MRLAAVHTGDVVAIPGPGEPRLGEVRAQQRGHLHAGVTARHERGELEPHPLTPNINYFRARPRDLQTRPTENAK